VKANLEFAYEIDNPPISSEEMKDAPILRNRAKVLYAEGKYDEALSLYDESLSIRGDVVALCGKAQVLGSKGDYEAMVDTLDRADAIDYREIVSIMAYFSKDWQERESDTSCYVSRCALCGSDVVGVLSKKDKSILWSRHKAG
jgi:tetratricopeptide (TPR) repeat protein